MRAYDVQDLERHAEMLANRVKKNSRRLKDSFARKNIGAYRLYDRDIPEVRVVVDYYEGHLVVSEYVRLQTASVPEWLETMGRAAANAIGVPHDRIHLKRRRTRPSRGSRYAKLRQTGRRMKVREGDFEFWVNLDDYVDTGLFPDHRNTRAMVKGESQGAHFLNLFGYTGAFTCYAAKGGAKTTITVDLSRTYLEWARDNMRLAGHTGSQHQFAQENVWHFLDKARSKRHRFGLCVLDPPSFSTVGEGSADFDIQRDHVALLEQTLLLMNPGGILYFSTNHQRFEPHFRPHKGTKPTQTRAKTGAQKLNEADCQEITATTVPLDYRNKNVHRVWRIQSP